MLAFIFRGVFLVAVLSWYSTNVWKMIDGYFKDRFQNYLQEEFRKNPRMHADINSYAIKHAEKKGIDITDRGIAIPAPEARRVEESLETGTSSVDLLATAASFSESAELAKETGSGTGENRVQALVDKHAFPESVEPLDMSSERKEKPKSTGSDGFEERFAAEITEKKEKQEKGNKEKEKKEEAKKDASHDQRETLKKRRSIIESGKHSEESKKRKVRTITLTEADFKSAKISENDDDFSEFDLDVQTLKVKEPREGVLVSELPFKPRADIGDLEIVTADEFCPLTLEDEATCGIPSKWP
ncbi:E3 ubiquitin-protein ligase BRE1A-like [Belonocnema kinseyi]|uniref:E3 ubiquitin-protein ligase BRE1A-like n=1 Tax=Belonocnema kinseyi TaxID=2817044 RepID=UPI00143DAB13|nr:E3 ubiquitin-protein ligase BRE1A-like [Belonocnema kinseyi]